MPPRGGAFFGFAIVVLVALITWGIIALVEVAQDDSSGDSGDFADSRDVDSELQARDSHLCEDGVESLALALPVRSTNNDSICVRMSV